MSLFRVCSWGYQWWRAATGTEGGRWGRPAQRRQSGDRQCRLQDEQDQISRGCVDVKVKQLSRPLVNIPKVSDTLFTFVTDGLNYTQWNPGMHHYYSSPSFSNFKTNQLHKAKRCDKASHEHKMHLTIHGVVASRGLLAEAAAHGAALSLGHKILPAGETLVAGKVALWGMAWQMSAALLKWHWMAWAEKTWIAIQRCKHKINRPCSNSGMRTGQETWASRLSLSTM